MATNKSFGNKQTKPDKFFALLLLLGHTRLPVLGDLVIEIKMFGPDIDKLINLLSNEAKLYVETEDNKKGEAIDWHSRQVSSNCYWVIFRALVIEIKTVGHYIALFY